MGQPWQIGYDGLVAIDEIDSHEGTKTERKTKKKTDKQMQTLTEVAES